jgi:hypothetical protein
MGKVLVKRRETGGLLAWWLRTLQRARTIEFSTQAGGGRVSDGVDVVEGFG